MLFLPISVVLFSASFSVVIAIRVIVTSTEDRINTPGKPDLDRAADLAAIQDAFTNVVITAPNVRIS